MQIDIPLVAAGIKKRAHALLNFDCEFKHEWNELRLSQYLLHPFT